MVVTSPPSLPQPTWLMPLDVVGAPQMGGERQWTGVGVVGQLGAVSWPFGVGVGQVGGARSTQFGQIGGRHAGGVGGNGQLDGVPSWNRGGERQQSGVGWVGQRGGATWPVGVGVGQMGGSTSSSQFGQMGGEEWRGAGVDWTSQGLVGATQLVDERQWNGVGGFGQLGGVATEGVALHSSRYVPEPRRTSATWTLRS